MRTKKSDRKRKKERKKKAAYQKVTHIKCTASRTVERARERAKKKPDREKDNNNRKLIHSAQFTELLHESWLTRARAHSPLRARPHFHSHWFEPNPLAIWFRLCSTATLRRPFFSSFVVAFLTLRRPDFLCAWFTITFCSLAKWLWRTHKFAAENSIENWSDWFFFFFKEMRPLASRGTSTIIVASFCASLLFRSISFFDILRVVHASNSCPIISL